MGEEERAIFLIEPPPIPHRGGVRRGEVGENFTAAVVFIGTTQGVCDLMNLYHIKFVGCQTNINVLEDALWREATLN